MIGHYVPKLLEEWRSWETEHFHKYKPETVGMVRNSIDLIVDAMEQAACWTISKEAFELIWRTDLSADTLQGMRLPYPVMAIEYMFDYDLLLGRVKNETSDPADCRIILLTEISEKAFAITSAYKFSDDHETPTQWVVSPISVIINYDSFENVDSWFKVDKTHMGYDVRFENNYRPEELDSKSAPMLGPALPMYQDLVSEMDKEEFKKLASEMADEMKVCFGLLAILTCSNCPTEKIAPPAKLNKKRVKSGRPFIPEYRTLHITDHTSRPSAKGSGTHASPKTHWRRGHIRNQPTARGVVKKWIKPTIIGAGAVSKPEVVVT